MRKKSTRLLSAALAVCMMLSVLPVGAFALEVGAADPAAAVSEQKAATPYHLDGSKKIDIDEDFIKEHGSTYTIGGEETYQYPITIDTNQDVTIKFINNVNSHIVGTSADLIAALRYQRSFINAKKVGKLIISNEGNYKFDNPWWGGRFLGVTAPNAIVEVNGGTYCSGGVGAFYFNNGCKATLTDVTVDNYQYECVYNDNATVTIDRGSYTAKRGVAISNNSGGMLDLNPVMAVGTAAAVVNEGGNVTINGGRYTNSIVDGDCRDCSAVSNDYLPVYGYDATMTIWDGEFETKGKNAAAIVNSTRDGNDDHGWLEIKGGTFTASKDGGRGIEAQDGVSRIENATIKGCQYGICCGVPGGETSQVTIKDVLFEDNTNDVYQDRSKHYMTDDGQYTTFVYPLVEIEEGRNEVITAGTDDTFVGNAGVIGGDIKGRQFTTATDSHYQKDLKLVSTDPKYIIDYQKDDDGEFRYFNTRDTGKYYVNPINATMAFGGEEKRPYSQFAVGEKVTLTAFPAEEEGKRCTGWKVEKIIAAEPVTDVSNTGVITYDPENPETATLTVQDYDVFVTAVYGDEGEIVDPGTGGDAAGNIQGAISAVVIGAAAGAIIYEAGTGIYRVINMPGIPMPSNRIELAELLWEHAGKPEPESTALYSDIDEGDTDAQKAARWAVEQDLMKDDADNNKFNPYFPVSKLRTCLTWNAAKEKGLFDTDKTAE